MEIGVSVERRVIVNKEGYLVDAETGEVIEDQPICYDARCETRPSSDRSEWERRLRAAPLPRGMRRSQGNRDWRILTIKVPPWLVEALDHVVQEHGWSSRSSLVREVLERFLSRPGGPLDVTEALRELRNLYALRSFAMAAQHLLSMGRVYAPEIYRQDISKLIEELEALIHHLNSDLNELNKKLGLW